MDFKELFWNATNEEYFNTGMHHSLMSDFLENGFRQDWTQTFERTPALVIGSAVDCILTNGGYEAYKNEFFDAGSIDEKSVQFATYLADNAISDIEPSVVINFLDTINWQSNWKPETRVAKFLEKFGPGVDLIRKNPGKTGISESEKRTAFKCVEALRQHPQCWFFKEGFKNDPNSPVQVYFQPKMKMAVRNVLYAIMFDVLVVDFEERRIYPMDLKTCTCEEWNFRDNFKKFHYDIQARLYSRILRLAINETEEFKDMEIMPFTFIVCSKQTFTPLLFEYDDNLEIGDLEYGRFKSRDPFDVGSEIQQYIATNAKVPRWIDQNGINQLNL